MAHITPGGQSGTSGDAAWTVIGSGGSAPAFQNSWTNLSGSFVTARYRKIAGGLVVVEGMIVPGTLGTVAFTLPAGYRPSGQLWVTSHGYGGSVVSCQIQVQSTGDVGVGTNGTGGTAENSICFSFYADA